MQRSIEPDLSWPMHSGMAGKVGEGTLSKWWIGFQMKTKQNLFPIRTIGTTRGWLFSRHWGRKAICFGLRYLPFPLECDLLKGKDNACLYVKKLGNEDVKHWLPNPFITWGLTKKNSWFKWNVKKNWWHLRCYCKFEQWLDV